MSDTPAICTDSPPAMLAAAICAVMAEVGTVEKTGRNKDQGYSYASDADLLNALQPAMVKHGLALVPCACDLTVSEHSQTRAGHPQWRADVVQTYSLLHTGGSSVRIQTAGSGLDGQDKHVYKALTGALKYALRQTFLVPTGDDAEHSEPEQGPSPNFADAMARLKGAGGTDEKQWSKAVGFAKQAKAGMSEDEVEKVREYISAKESKDAQVSD